MQLKHLELCQAQAKYSVKYKVNYILIITATESFKKRDFMQHKFLFQDTWKMPSFPTAGSFKIWKSSQVLLPWALFQFPVLLLLSFGSGKRKHELHEAPG